MTLVVKAVCSAHYVTVSGSDATKFMVTSSIAGLASGNPVTTTIEIGPFAANIGASYLSDEIREAVKDYLINSHGYTFGLLDTVRLIGALV